MFQDPAALLTAALIASSRGTHNRPGAGLLDSLRNRHQITTALIIKQVPDPQQLIDALIVVMGPDVTTGVTTAISFPVSARVFLTLFESCRVYFF